MNKIIIAGSRNFTDYNFLDQKLKFILSNLNYDDIEIVSGTANGADKLGEKFANDNNIKIKQFPANWDKYGKSAGYIRNKEMAKYSTHCVVFWDGVSKGTKHMINLANEYNLELKIVKWK